MWKVFKQTCEELGNSEGSGRMHAVDWLAGRGGEGAAVSGGKAQSPQKVASVEAGA